MKGKMDIHINPKKRVIVHKGGTGSGHHGHSGRPGKVGGSQPKGGESRHRLIDDVTEVAIAYGKLAYIENFDDVIATAKADDSYDFYFGDLDDAGMAEVEAAYYAKYPRDDTKSKFPLTKTRMVHGKKVTETFNTPKDLIRHFADRGILTHDEIPAEFENYGLKMPKDFLDKYKKKS